VHSLLEVPGFDHVVTDGLVQMLVPWRVWFRSTGGTYGRGGLPIVMEIFRDEKLEVQKAGIDQFLCDILDRDVRLCDDPDCVRWMLGDLALNGGGDDSGLSGPWRPLTPIVR